MNTTQCTTRAAPAPKPSYSSCTSPVNQLTGHRLLLTMTRQSLACTLQVSEGMTKVRVW